MRILIGHNQKNAQRKKKLQKRAHDHIIEV